jgi:hypothetical protein
MEYAQDFDCVCPNSIGDDIWRAGNDQFARALNSAGAAYGGVF